MPTGHRPPIVPHGPWRSAGHPPRPEPAASESGWGSFVWEMVSNLDGLFDVGEILFGFFRVVAHIIVAAIHAIFHL